MLIIFLHDRWVLPLHLANGMLFFPQLFLISACLSRYTTNFQLFSIPPFCHLDSRQISLSAIEVRTRNVGQEVVIFDLNLDVLFNSLKIVIVNLHWPPSTPNIAWFFDLLYELICGFLKDPLIIRWLLASHGSWYFPLGQKFIEMQLILAHFGFDFCELNFWNINFVSFSLELQMVSCFIGVVVIAFQI